MCVRQGVLPGMRVRKKKVRVYFTPNGAQLFSNPIPKEPLILSVLPTDATLETISRKEPYGRLGRSYQNYHGYSVAALGSFRFSERDDRKKLWGASSSPMHKEAVCVKSCGSEVFNTITVS